jgi:hypothetical protein
VQWITTRQSFVVRGEHEQKITVLKPKEKSMIINPNELRDRYAAGERNFSGINLSFADLSEIDLQGADLSRAVLVGANLERANLAFATLYGANLEQANLAKDSFFYANLRQSKLGNANLNGADLRAANLADAHLTGADLSDADLWAANLPEGFTPSSQETIAKATSPPRELLQHLVRLKNLNPVKLIARAIARPKKLLERKSTKSGSWEKTSPNSKLEAQLSWKQMSLTPEEAQRLQACIQEIAQILHRKANLDEIATLERIQNAFYFGLQYIGLL